MIKYRFNIILLSLILSSCSNLLTWHLDKGIHKETSTQVNSNSESETSEFSDYSSPKKHSTEYEQLQQQMKSLQRKIQQYRL